MVVFFSVLSPKKVGLSAPPPKLGVFQTELLLQGEHVAALVKEMAYRAAPHHWAAQMKFDGPQIVAGRSERVVKNMFFVRSKMRDIMKK